MIDRVDGKLGVRPSDKSSTEDDESRSCNR